VEVHSKLLVEESLQMLSEMHPKKTLALVPDPAAVEWSNPSKDRTSGSDATRRDAISERGLSALVKLSRPRLM
jgi:hypothetical protein